MGFLGPNLTATVLGSFLSIKLLATFDAAHRLLSGIQYYQLPDESQLRDVFQKAAPVGKDGSLAHDTFVIPIAELADLKLEQQEVIRPPAIGQNGILTLRPTYDVYSSVLSAGVAALLSLGTAELLSRALPRFALTSGYFPWALALAVMSFVYILASTARASVKHGVRNFALQRSVRVTVFALVAALLLLWAADPESSGLPGPLVSIDLRGQVFDSMQTMCHAFMTSVNQDPLSSCRMSFSNLQLSVALLLGFSTGVMAHAARRRARAIYHLLFLLPGTGRGARLLAILPLALSALFCLSLTPVLPLVPGQQSALAGLAAVAHMLALRPVLAAYLAAVPFRLRRLAAPGASSTRLTLGLAELQSHVVPTLLQLCVVATELLSVPLLMALAGSVAWSLQDVTASLSPGLRAIGTLAKLTLWWLHAATVGLTLVGLARAHYDALMPGGVVSDV
ncbi:hypothetical protein H696_04949 [Fonticula alba]|uniref:Uncharacterized protein n=1 Tax=Fonticula alba TaxID=691883 RepID=A0A058Z401_FONAL|nr:hypothetical protein H696_04949 [Fonticula alba]KCV68658.1 hypothetical protein H696_04949 [Fonticula alba]|eukprot:XP_009497090.1 hypothetical protein H696_04949 [Fonticula alba]